jgi:hypothetical protein
VKTAVVTAAAGNYVPLARVMAESLRRHHPEVPVLLALSDEPRSSLRSDEPFELLRFDLLSRPARRRLLFAYERREAAIALKPYALEAALDMGFEAVLYVDVDALVLSSISDLLAAIRTAAITLVPHLLGPLEGPDRAERELNILQSGTFNGGVLGVRASSKSRTFLAWWRQRVSTDCRHATTEGLHYDQRWLDLVPSYFDDVQAYDDPTVNVAHWNLPERDLANCRLFHFSGYDPDRPDVLTHYSDRLAFDDVPEALPLFARYRNAVLAAGWREERDRPYAYDHFDNGVPIPPYARETYRQLGAAGERFGDPFAAGAPGSFYRWLRGRLLVEPELAEAAEG